MSYTNEQLMLVFSYIAYYGIGLETSNPQIANKISSDIDLALKTWTPVKDQWSLVWGPGLFAFKGDRFDDNLMYVVQSKLEPSKYVIAIRGTNPVSLRDWLIEDFDVTPMHSWPYGQPPKSLEPKIAKGTYIGLTRLHNMRADHGVPGDGKTLLAFLQSVHEADDKQTPLNITVTGHSLGGALAPTLALWLENIRGKDLPENINISTVAFAGPSAGNKDFARFSDACLGDACVRIANSLDVVPYAWSTSTLRKLFTLYKPHFLFPGPVLAGMFSVMLLQSLRGNYQQIKPATPSIEGQYKHLLYNYFAQALYQHVIGYPEIMDLLKNDEIPLNELFSLSGIY